MALNRSRFQRIGAALRGLLSSFGSPNPNAITTAKEKPAELPESKKTPPEEQKSALPVSSTAFYLSELSDQLKPDESSVIEVMPVNAGIFRGIGGIILSYVAMDMDLAATMISNDCYRVRLMGWSIRECVLAVLDGKHNGGKAAEVARLVLSAEEKDIDAAENFTAQDPQLVRTYTVARDRLRRPVFGTNYQIAKMYSDEDLLPEIKDPKHKGAAERLAHAGALTVEEQAEQNQVVTSNAAQLADERRAQHVLTAAVTFAENIQGLPVDESLSVEAYRTTYCRQIITDCHAKLTLHNENELTVVGHVFSPDIMRREEQWYKNNSRSYFGSNWNKYCIYETNCYGKLQKQLCSRDAHVVRPGADKYVENKEIPARTLLNADGTSDFAADSKLGDLFCIEYYGRPSARRRRGPYGSTPHVGHGRFFGILMSNKNHSQTINYAATRVSQEQEVVLDNDGLPSRPTATAARQ